jgi:hypothetical protein
MKKITNKSFDEERALYASSDIKLENCRFDGAADGESALKESRGVSADECFFNLRYPFWHVDGFEISRSHLTELCRAPLWYSRDGVISDSRLAAPKALRECGNIKIDNCEINSVEFGWFCNDIKMSDCQTEGAYFMLRSSRLEFSNIRLNGKYSFQYISDCVFENCDFDTKDAFWHAKNVIVRNSRVSGEYLGWYCENVTFENCILSGTQPLCYCRGLRLINCEMHGADLAFEKSDVDATITTPVISIKNPTSGRIKVPCATIIRDDENSKCVIE